MANIYHVPALAWAVRFYGKHIRQSRVINLSWFARTFLVLAPKVLHPRKPLSLRQMGMIGHPKKIRCLYDPELKNIQFLFCLYLPTPHKVPVKAI